MTSNSPDECFELFEDIPMTSYQSPHSDSSRKGVLQVDSNTALAEQVCEICRGSSHV